MNTFSWDTIQKREENNKMRVVKYIFFMEKSWKKYCCVSLKKRIPIKVFQTRINMRNDEQMRQNSIYERRKEALESYSLPSQVEILNCGFLISTWKGLIYF